MFNIIFLKIQWNNIFNIIFLKIQWNNMFKEMFEQNERQKWIILLCYRIIVFSSINYSIERVNG